MGHRLAAQQPVSNGDADVIEPGLGNCIEVVLGNPSVPMVAQSRRSLGLAEGLGVGVLVDNRMTCCPLVEYGGCNPWLQDKPAAEVDPADLVTIVVERDCAFVELASTFVRCKVWPREVGSIQCGRSPGAAENR